MNPFRTFESSLPAPIPGVDESGLRRLPEAPEPDLLLSDLPDLSELIEPLPTAAGRPRATPPPVPPSPRRGPPAASPLEPFDFSNVLSWYRPRIVAEGEEIARVSIPPGLILPRETDDALEPWEPTMAQVVWAATVAFAVVWAAASLLA